MTWLTMSYKPVSSFQCSHSCLGSGCRSHNVELFTHAVGLSNAVVVGVAVGGLCWRGCTRKYMVTCFAYEVLVRTLCDLQDPKAPDGEMKVEEADS